MSPANPLLAMLTGGAPSGAPPTVRVTVISPGAPEGINRLDLPKAIAFATLYRLIGCELVQIVDLRNGLSLVIDEEGKLRAHEPNQRATDLARAAGALLPGDYIAGRAVLCNLADFPSEES